MTFKSIGGHGRAITNATNPISAPQNNFTRSGPGETVNQSVPVARLTDLAARAAHRAGSVNPNEAAPRPRHCGASSTTTRLAATVLPLAPNAFDRHGHYHARHLQIVRSPPPMSTTLRRSTQSSSTLDVFARQRASVVVQAHESARPQDDRTRSGQPRSDETVASVGLHTTPPASTATLASTISPRLGPNVHCDARFARSLAPHASASPPAGTWCRSRSR